MPSVDRKIIVKGSAKDYKRGPGLTKRARLYRSLVRLQLSAARLGRTNEPDAMWAACLSCDLVELTRTYSASNSPGARAPDLIVTS